MALRNAEKFEQMDGAETTTAEAAPAAASIGQPQTKARPANTAVAAARPTAVATATAPSKFIKGLGNLQNMMNPADLPFNAYKRIVPAAGGSFMVDKTVSLGDTIDVEVLSWNERWTASPGGNSEEDNDAARFSLDGVHLDGEDTLLLDYVRELRETGHKDAKIKKYIALWCWLIRDKSGPIAPADRDIMEVQLSPSSVGKFNAWQGQHGMKVSRGYVPDSAYLRCHAKTGVNGKNTFGYSEFETIYPEEGF